MLEYLFGRLARRWSWLRGLLDVQQRFGEVKGGYLASAVTLNLFLSLFPLLLVAIAALGFVTNNNVNLVRDAIASVVPEEAILSIVDNALEAAVDSRRTASLLGFLLLVWGALGVSAAIGYAVDTAWQLNGRGLIEKIPGVLWALGAGALLATSIALTAAADLVVSGWLLTLASMVGSLAVNVIFFIWTFSILTSKRLPLKAHLPGSILGGLGLEVIKQLVKLLPDLLGRPAAVWGSIGAVFAVIATLAVFGRLLVYASVYNVIRWERHYGTLTLEIEVPNLPGVNPPMEVNRGGAVEDDGDGDAIGKT